MLGDDFDQYQMCGTCKLSYLYLNFALTTGVGPGILQNGGGANSPKPLQGQRIAERMLKENFWVSIHDYFKKFGLLWKTIWKTNGFSMRKIGSFWDFITGFALIIEQIKQVLGETGGGRRLLILSKGLPDLIEKGPWWGKSSSTGECLPSPTWRQHCLTIRPELGNVLKWSKTDFSG